MNRQMILNPHNNEYEYHNHKHDGLINITYRCGHIENTFIGWCTDESKESRVERLKKLLCVLCEETQLKAIADSFIDYSEPVTADTLIIVEEIDE